MDSIRKPATGNLKVKGIDISCQRAGNGPALMLVHGGASDSRSWTPQLEALSDVFTVMVWDEPETACPFPHPGRSTKGALVLNCSRVLSIAPDFCLLTGLRINKR
jgi:hypothetical protein